MLNGQKIQREEQQQLWEHRRAVTEPLPDEMNPVAVGQDEQRQQQAYPQRVLPANVVAFPGNERVSEGDISQCSAANTRTTSFSSSATAAKGEQAQLTNSPPTNEEGNTLNPDAYKLWKPKPVEGEKVVPEQFRAKLTKLTHNLSMPQPPKPEREPKDELEELNQWLTRYLGLR